MLWIKAFSLLFFLSFITFSVILTLSPCASYLSGSELLSMCCVWQVPSLKCCLCPEGWTFIFPSKTCVLFIYWGRGKETLFGLCYDDSWITVIIRLIFKSCRAPGLADLWQFWKEHWVIMSSVFTFLCNISQEFRGKCWFPSLLCPWAQG